MSILDLPLVVAHLPIDKRVKIILVWLAFALIAFALVLIFSRYYPRRTRSPKHVSLPTLRKMYARGDINLSEYERELKRRGHEKER